MSLIDNALMYADKQDVTVTADSTNHIDHGVARDLGAGRAMYLLLSFGTVVSNATLAAKITGDDDDAATNVIDIAVAKTITPLSNTFYAIPIPSHTPKRYTKCVFTVAGGSTPHIPITATLVDGREIHPSSRSY